MSATHAHMYQRPRIIHTTRDIIIVAIILILVMLAVVAHGVAQSIDNSATLQQKSNTAIRSA